MHTNSSKKRASVSIVGARGYSGIALAERLLRHPDVALTHCFATRDFRLSDEILSDAAKAVVCLTDSHVMQNLTDIVFLATPAEVSHELAPKIMQAGKLVIDLSGAFRLTDSEPWYGFKAENVGEYGLVPFAGTFDKSVRLIANPGCFATAVHMALIPLLKHGLIETDGLAIDAKSGTTGAGKKALEHLLYSEVEGQCLPYRVGRHQHLPEIKQGIGQFAGVAIDPHFVTHLLPLKRGLSAAIFARSKTDGIADIAAAFAREYADYPLVRHGENIDQLANLQKVVGTPHTHISYTLVGQKLYVFSAIDNLLKGAASQAIENLNRVLDRSPAFSLIGEG